MTRIGLLSDTHGYLDPRVLEHFACVDEIWHAGDIGSAMVLQHLREFKPTRAVYGNMDSGDVRYSLSEFSKVIVRQIYKKIVKLPNNITNISTLKTLLCSNTNK